MYVYAYYFGQIILTIICVYICIYCDGTKGSPSTKLKQKNKRKRWIMRKSSEIQITKHLMQVDEQSHTYKQVLFVALMQILGN